MLGLERVRLVRAGSGQKTFSIPAGRGWESYKDQVSDDIVK